MHPPLSNWKAFNFKYLILKKRLLDLSIFLSVLSIVLTVIINFQIAKTYLRAGGKTRALFGITEMLQFGYQYYVAGIGLLSILVAIINKGPWTTKKYMAMILSFSSLLIIFLRIWRLFV